MRHISKDDVQRLEIGLTSTCNLECPLCMRQTHPKFQDSPIKFRSLQEITQQLDEYISIKFVTIAGAISEPTLHPQLFDILKYLIDRGIEISLFLNGNTHNDMYYKKLGVIFRRAKGNIYFTICGSTQELHSRYRVNSSLKTVIRHLDIIDNYTS